MGNEEIREKLVAIIAEQLGMEAADINDSMTFTEDLGADSLDTVEMIMQFEEVFSIEIADDDAAKLADINIGDVVGFISERQS